MELVYIRYKPKNYNVLLLQLGTRNSKLVGLVSSKVTDSDRERLKSAKSILAALSVDRCIGWVKEHCPASYRAAYKEILLSNINIISSHRI